MSKAKAAGWGLAGALILLAVLIYRAGLSDTWRKILFYGGALVALALKAAGWVIALPWSFVPVLAAIGVLTEPDSTATAAQDSVNAANLGG